MRSKPVDTPRKLTCRAILRWNAVFEIGISSLLQGELTRCRCGVVAAVGGVIGGWGSWVGLGGRGWGWGSVGAVRVRRSLTGCCRGSSCCINRRQLFLHQTVHEVPTQRKWKKCFRLKIGLDSDVKLGRLGLSTQWKLLDKCSSGLVNWRQLKTRRFNWLLNLLE